MPVPVDMWAQIETELAQLAQDKSAQVFRELVEKLQQWLTIKPPPHSPEIYLTVIESIKAASQQIANGAAPRDVVQQASAGAFVQTVEADRVYQANGNIFQFLFQEPLQKVNQPAQQVRVPFVLLVMTAKEASELETGDAFNDYPGDYPTDFKALLGIMHGYDWKNFYGATPQDWRPHFDTRSIGELVAQMLKMLQTRIRFAKEIVPEFIDIRQLADDRRRLIEMRERGCVVINDVVSLRHPLIQRSFRRSLLDAFPTTMIVRIAPVADAFKQKPPQPFITFSETFEDSEFFKRITDFDDTCRQVDEATEFGSWFFSHVPKIIPQDEATQAGARNQWFK